MSWKLSVICISLSVMACGMSMPTESPESVSKTVLINAPELSPVPVPTVQLPEKATVCGGWNVRETADPDSEWQSYILPNSPVTLTGKTANAPDGGKWVQLVDRDGKNGWMNAKGLCHD